LLFRRRDSFYWCIFMYLRGLNDYICIPPAKIASKL
jgi:hypothetical protein